MLFRSYFFGPDGPGDHPPEGWTPPLGPALHHHAAHPGHYHHHHDHCADECDDQLPVAAAVGRGLPGDGFYVTISDPDTCTETYLEGWHKDNVTGELTREWKSLNINGGELSYQYNLRPFTNPQCFTITFIYRRPGRCEWSWTTPAIPYVWDANGDGEPDVDGIIGSGVGDIYIRTAATDHPDIINEIDPVDDAWNERLHFPPGTFAEDYNAPKPLSPWSATITFGFQGGDVLVPNIYDLADITGWSPDVMWQVTAGKKGQFDGSDNIKDYIDDQLGFPPGVLPGDGGTIPVYQFIINMMNDLFGKIYNPYPGAQPTQPSPPGPPSGRVNDDGTITWTSPVSDKIAIGNMNLYGGSNMENWIKTDEDGDNDVRAM